MSADGGRAALISAATAVFIMIFVIVIVVIVRRWLGKSYLQEFRGILYLDCLANGVKQTVL